MAIAAVLFACLRIAATWNVFNETTDEAIHIACGMEWLDAGRYLYEAQHPPLSRIVMAAGPRLAGCRTHGLRAPVEEGQAILNSQGEGQYFRVLSLARAGNLLFVALACFGVWALARTLWGESESAWAVVAFSLLPPVLGHGGLATTDMALAATVALAAAAWRRVVPRPSAGRVTLAGIATGLAFSSKFSAFIFLPAVVAPLVLFPLTASHSIPASGPQARRFLRLAVVAVCACLLTVWASYRFQVLPLRLPGEAAFPAVDRAIGTQGALHDLAYRVFDTPLPLTALVRGMGEVYSHNVHGHEAYLFGRIGESGWWYFFPVILAVKTPLAFLMLCVCGAILLARDGRWQDLSTVAAALAIVAICVPSRINIGVRHVLPVYVFAALPAGYALARLLRPARRPALAAGVLLLGSLAVPGIATHPDYLADFNLIAGSDPARIAIDSDLDWGQDLERATRALQARGAQEAWIAYLGPRDFLHDRRVRYRHLPPGQQVRGWVAISVRALYLERARRAQGRTREDYDWLAAFPAERIGRSMLLYHVP